jgi:hypothetical protein
MGYSTRPDPVEWGRAVALIAGTVLPEQRDEIRRALEADADCFSIDQHFGMGMGIRNILRRNGFDERTLGVPDLDHVWVAILREALEAR